MTFTLHGLIAATHTPFLADGSLNESAVEKQADHLIRNGVGTAFIGGTTGESSSLTVSERLKLSQRWMEIARGSKLRIVVHVGSNCLADARALAAQAQRLGLDAVSALAPSYFKPRSLEALIACCADIASEAPELPFYYYDIPSLTGVSFSMPAFLEAAADKIPNLAGIKFTNTDLMAYQQSLRAAGGRYDLPWGVDEALLAATAMGAKGAVGSTYNFAAPIYHRLLAAFARSDWEAARSEQYRSVQLVDLLSRHGYMAAAKATMEFLGVPVGPPRLPNVSLSADQQTSLRKSLELLGFFEWVQA